jgi:hypothetical protein
MMISVNLSRQALDTSGALWTLRHCDSGRQSGNVAVSS